MRVPLIDLSAQYRKIRPAIDEAVSQVLVSGRYVMGPEIERFEKELGGYLGGKHVVGVSSGTDALLSAAMALNVGLGSGGSGKSMVCTRNAEVVTTAYSFFATPETAIRLGVRPVFCDIAEGSFNADVDDMLSRVNPNTAAILPVHMFGLRMDVTRLVATGIPVIEDAAQTLVPGIAEESDCATLSFFPTKNLGAVGDGGAVVTKDAGLAEKLSIMRQHGSKPKYVHHVWGGNFRLDPIQAAVLRVKLTHLEDWQAARRKNAARYRDGLSDLPVILPETRADHVYHHFVIRTEKRDGLKAHLSAREIDTEVYYPTPLHLQPCFAQFGYREGSLPRAEAASRESLAIPIHPDLSLEQVDFVIDSVRAFFRN